MEDRKQKYLDEQVFYGLTDLNTGFDSPVIRYFSAEEFAIVLERVEQLKLGIFGIEPWKNGHFFGVSSFEDYTEDPTDSQWYKRAFREFLALEQELQYAASYYIPGT